MPDTELLLSRIAVLESKTEDLRARLESHEKRHDEFMLRTDQRLEVLLGQSSEWSGVRKTLGVTVSLVGAFGGVIGWLVHMYLGGGRAL